MSTVLACTVQTMGTVLARVQYTLWVQYSLCALGLASSGVGGCEMTGRQPQQPPYRNKKLVRSRRLSNADSSDDSVGGEDPATPSQRPPWTRELCDGAAPTNTPTSRWKRASVKAVELQGWLDVWICILIYISI